MLNYKPLDLECKHVSEKILDYIKTSNIELDIKHFWINVDSVDLLSKVPELQQMFDSMNLTIDFVAILSTRDKNGIIHIDNGLLKEDPSVRINIPILNCDKSSTNFYKLIEGTSLKTTALLHDNTPFYFADLNDCVLIDSFVLTMPTVLNVNVLHQVNVIDPNVLRVSCTIFFKENIEYLLKN